MELKSIFGIITEILSKPESNSEYHTHSETQMRRQISPESELLNTVQNYYHFLSGLQNYSQEPSVISYIVKDTKLSFILCLVFLNESLTAFAHLCLKDLLQELEPPLISLSFTYPISHPIHILLVLPSKYIQNQTTCHYFCVL